VAKILTDAGIRKLKPHSRDRREIPDAQCPGLYLSVYPSGIKSFVMRYKRSGGKSVRLTLGRWFGDSHDGDSRSEDKELRAEIERLRAENKLLREAASPVAPLTPKAVQKKKDEPPKIGDRTLSLKAARRLCTQLQDQRERGKDPASERRLERSTASQRADSTFAACAMQFIQEHKIARADAPERRPRGWREGARLLGWSFPTDERDGEPTIVKGSLVARWGDRPVDQIDVHEIAAVIDESRRHGIPGLRRFNDGLSNNRARKMHAILHVLFGWLQGENRIVANPVAGLKRPKPPASRDRVLNCKPDVRGADEIRFFWHGLSEVRQPWQQLFRLLLVCGCRLDELAQAEHSELNDDRTVLHLPGSRTKNSRAFDLPLPPLATELINSIEPVSDRYVFSVGRAPLAGHAAQKRRLDAAMLKLAKAERGPDVEIPPWRLHDLRRTAATGMASIGIEPHIIESTLNHISGFKAGIAGTYNREQYSAEKAAALIKWSEHVERVVTGTGGGKVLPMTRKRGA
jgi:integrase